MKNLKNTLGIFLAGLFVMSLLFSCQKEKLEEVPQEEVSQMEMVEWFDTDTPQTRIPDNGTSTCYTASVSVDKDCDGSFELGWNQATASYGGCIVLLNNMIATAQANGWCYKVSSPNCGIYIGTCR